MCVFMLFFSSPRQGGTGTPAKSRMEVRPNAMEAVYLLSMPRRRSFPVWPRGCGRGARGCCSQWGEDEGGVPRCGQLSGVWGLGPGEEDVSVCCRDRRECWCGCRPGWSVFPVGRRFPARLRHRGRGRGLWVQRGRSLLVLPRSPALVRRLPRHIQSFLHRVRQASLVNLPLGWLGAGGLVIAADVVLADGLVISW